MSKVLLLSFDADGRAARARNLEEAGFSILAQEPSWPSALEAAKKLEPDVIAIDCASLPSLCRETGESLRTHAMTKELPVVLFRVADHEIERTRLQVAGGVVAFDYELIDRLKSAALTRLANQAAAESAAARAAQERKLARRAAKAASSAKRVVEAKPRASSARTRAAARPATRTATRTAARTAHATTPSHSPAPRVRILKASAAKVAGAKRPSAAAKKPLAAKKAAATRKRS